MKNLQFEHIYDGQEYMWKYAKQVGIGHLLTTVTVPFSQSKFTNRDGSITLAYYKPIYYEGHRFGEICINVETCVKLGREELFEVMRHELAHAIVDLIHGKHREGHGRTWIRIAKLMRVDTSRYERELGSKCCGAF